jgi:hypothetical protein
MLALTNLERQKNGQDIKQKWQRQTLINANKH